MACPRFSLDEIKRATNDFALENRIGEGETGVLYRGNISDDSYSGQIAVKRFCSYENLTLDFQKEIEVLTARRHANIISVLGICEEEHEKIIIYELMPNGSLHHYVYKDKEYTPRLTVEQRLEISLGVAKGLAYLHSDTDGSHFIHRNLTPHCIMLDASLVPKITGCGLSMTRAAGPTSSQLVTRHIQGTEGYIPPECYEPNYKLSRKADVYAFGVVLLELLCERSALDRLLILSLPFVIRGELPKFIPEHVRKNISPKCARACEQLIRDCLEYERDKRPDMNQIVLELELASKLQKQNIMFQPNTQQQQSSSVNNHSKSFSLAEIETATKNYSKALGEGGQAEVFYGKISDESNYVEVAVKRMSGETKEGIQAFEIERSLLSACHHPNIISLVGFCDEGDKKILVYEFMPKGSLHDYLYKRNEGTPPLTVEQRLGICIGVAKGLGYLHSQKDYNEVIVHSDIKTDNILLDGDFLPKISDFGLSRTRVADQSTLKNVTYTRRGTDGYMAPECYEPGHMISRKADVYAFGVVLLEVLCEKRAWEQLVIWAQRFLFKGELPTFVPQYVTKNISPECSRACVSLIRDCLNTDQNIRPFMSNVIENLEFALALQKMNMDANSQISHFQAINQKTFSISDIKRATNEFEHPIEIGEKQFGRFYRGNISMPIDLAVKRVNFAEIYTIQSFRKEIDLLSTCHHPNVISLLGCSDESDEKTLVFEFMPNGSLYDHLYNKQNPTIQLTVEQRLEICLGVAKGLNYLHSGTMFTIIHSNLKSENILLDGNLVAKISGFELYIKCDAGLSNSQEHTDIIQGTKGYIAPECHENNIPSPKRDVYAFGVILLEVLCEKRAWEKLHLLALPFLMKGELPKFSPKQVQKNISLECLRLCVNLIRDCVDNDPNNRPSMNQVVDRLELALNVQKRGGKTTSQLT